MSHVHRLRIARVDAQRNVDYYLPDALGSSRVVTDSSGNILDDCDFLPFGDEQCIKSGSGNTYQFTGKERDSESGNDNFGARTYEDGLGRFLSPDPLDPTKLTGGAFTAYLANPQHWDRYAYTLDNPTTDTDPTGLDACDSDNGACAATVPRQDNKQQMEKNQQARAQQQNQDQNQQNQQTSNSSSGRVNSPSSGDPDSTVRIPGNKPGSQTDRTYGPDGRAVKDVDYGHDHGKGDPHAHDWDWTKARPRQPGRPLTPEEKQQIQNTAKKASIWGTVGVVTYWIVSEGSRIFPPRDLIPIP